jgi:hypothetical protein
MNQVCNTRENAEFLYRISNSINPYRGHASIDNLVILPEIRREYNYKYENDKYELKYSESKNRLSLHFIRKNCSLVDVVKKMKKPQKQVSMANVLPPLYNNLI